MAIMALDHGEKRIGVAVTDPSGSIPLGLPTVETDAEGGEVDRIAELAEERGVELIVVGLPKHSDGTEGQRARKARGFVKQLKKRLKEIDFEFFDERFTSARARRTLNEEKADTQTRKKNMDRMSAQFILNRYLKSS